MDKQEQFMRINMLGQEAENIEQHMQAIDIQLQELNSVRHSIEAIESDKQKEILTNLGKGIFVRTEIKDKNLFVNVGGETIVKKTPQETLKIIQEQTEKMFAGKEQMTQQIENLQIEMKHILESVQGSEHSCGTECNHNDSEECDGNCECEEPCADCKHKH